MGSRFLKHYTISVALSCPNECRNQITCTVDRLAGFIASSGFIVAFVGFAIVNSNFTFSNCQCRFLDRHHLLRCILSGSADLSCGNPDSASFLVIRSESYPGNASKGNAHQRNESVEKDGRVTGAFWIT